MTDYIGPPEDERFDIDALADKSLEDVRPLLSDFDEELAQAGVELDIPGDDEDPEIDIQDYLSELQRRNTEVHVKRIRERLRLVGLCDADNLTTYEVSRLDADSVLQLDERNAESLFYHTSLKSGKILGKYYPVTWDTLRKQIYSLPKDEGYRKSLDLDMFQLQEWVNAQNYLIEVGLDPQDLARLTGTGQNYEKRPEAKQNVNRLSYLLQSEPLLRDFVKALPGWTAKRGKTTVHNTTKMALVILRLKTERAQKTKFYAEGKNELDSVDREAYKLTFNRLKAKTNIAQLILESSAYKSPEEFLQENS